MGLPARNPRLLVFQFPGPASAAERTQRHGRGGAGRLRAPQQLRQPGEVRRHAAGRAPGYPLLLYPAG
jgi:hypothetical protein